MRIVHISTSNSGGAGLVAMKLSQIQNEIGIESKVLTRDAHLTFMQGFFSKVNTLFSSKVSTRNYHQITPISISTFSFKKLREMKPDVIYIHNWFNFLSLDDLKMITRNFKTIFVLHDERLLTGGCHVTLGCEGYLRSCEMCPASRIPGLASMSKTHLSRKIEDFGDFGVITPSTWLLKKLEHSDIGKAATITAVIPNPVSSNFNQAITKNFQAETANAFFVSNDISISYKGADFLIATLRKLNFNLLRYSALNVTVLGSQEVATVNLKNGVVLNLRPTVTQKEMQKLYSESQFLFVPSASENHPGVVNEAQLSGTIVIASDVGGISEMVIDSESGFLSNYSVLEFQKTIERALSSPLLDSIAMQARESAERRTNPKNILPLHTQIINELSYE